ncbi:MAG: hypothetical protein ACRC3B_21835 [Bacteroidia bacterium]
MSRNTKQHNPLRFTQKQHKPMIICVILGCIQNPDQVIALQHSAGSVASAYAKSAANQIADQPARIGAVKEKISFSTPENLTTN